MRAPNRRLDAKEQATEDEHCTENQIRDACGCIALEEEEDDSSGRREPANRADYHACQV
ncbi:hypothetical protein [Micromonospora sp. NPDC005220]|uniref:hypothetical protein n=1 Tax=Micromonospora sp. NPDC005220 TaxID=3155589 RepID=UPI0033BD05EE